MTRALRWGLILIGLAMAGLSLVAYAGPGDFGMPPNPYAPQYGAELHQWVVLFTGATLALAWATYLSVGWLRWAVAALLVATWLVSVEPVRHYDVYYWRG